MIFSESLIMTDGYTISQSEDLWTQYCGSDITITGFDCDFTRENIEVSGQSANALRGSMGSEIIKENNFKYLKKCV